MDQQNQQPKPVPTAEEIARLEAEAAAALQRGEPISRHEPLPEREAPAAPARHDFVPYVDDVPDPKPAEPAPNSEAADDDEDEPYIPSPWEKRIDALSPQQWKRWQIAGGAAVGLAAVACLFVFGQELSTYGLIVAALLAILLPRYLERAWRRPLAVARVAMIVAMLIGLGGMTLVIFLRGR